MEIFGFRWIQTAEVSLGENFFVEMFPMSSNRCFHSANFQDDGPFELGAWSRVVAVFERVDSDTIQYLCNKYVNGQLMGTQVFDGDRRTVKNTGWLLFADDGLETPLNWAISSFAFVETPLSAEDVAALGGVDANGPFDGPPSGVNGVQFAFTGGQFVTMFGNGRLSQEVGERTPLQLTGPFRGHAETLRDVGVIGPAENQFRANAGSDQVLDLSSSERSVELVGEVHDPLNQVVRFEWVDESGVKVSESRNAEVDVLLGTQEYTFVCYNEEGDSSSDVVFVTGTDRATILFDNFDDGTLEGWTVSSGLIFAAGPVQSGTGTSDGRLQFSRSSQPGNALYSGEKEYTDNYRVEAQINNESLQPCGIIVGYSESGHYRLSFGVDRHSIRIEKVQGENVVVLAEQNDMGYYDQRFTASLALSEGLISASVNHQTLFGGAVVDPDSPLSGIAGLFHEGVFRMDVDNFFIQPNALFVHLGRDELIFVPPAGSVRLELSADTNTIGQVQYLLDGGELQQSAISIGEEGKHVIRAIAYEDSDSVWSVKTVRAVSQARVVVNETFESLDVWNFIDRGELNDPANWVIENGSLVQTSNRKSRQSMGVADESPSVEWGLGWSPLGDGFHILRLGATAIWADTQAMQWRDYTIVVDFSSPSAGGVGVLFRYQDEDNYIKLELDEKGGSSALTQKEAGVEQIQWQSQTGYDVSGTNTLQITVIGREVSVQLDGYPLFTPVEFRTINTGTIGLYTWDSPGTIFERFYVVNEALTDVVTSPTASPQQAPTPAVPTAEVPKCRRRSLRRQVE